MGSIPVTSSEASFESEGIAGLVVDADAEDDAAADSRRDTSDEEEEEEEAVLGSSSRKDGNRSNATLVLDRESRPPSSTRRVSGELEISGAAA